MVQIPCMEDAAIVYTDLNKHLPGTASMVFAAEHKTRPVYELLRVSTYPLYPVDRAEIPFLVIVLRHFI